MDITCLMLAEIDSDDSQEIDFSLYKDLKEDDRQTKSETECKAGKSVVRTFVTIFSSYAHVYVAR